MIELIIYTLIEGIKGLFAKLITYLFKKQTNYTKTELYRKPIPIYKFGDNLRESDNLERQIVTRKNKSYADVENILHNHNIN